MVQQRYGIIFALNFIKKNNFDQTLNTIKFSKGKIFVGSEERRGGTKYSVTYVHVIL